jgi:hypothetical protein
MSYGEYKFGDFAKLYDVGGPSDELVGFAQGFAQGFVPAYQAANKAAADKELALAKLDRAAKLDAEKAKTEANSEYEENMKSAKSIVAGVQLPEGVDESAAILYVFGQLNDAGLTPNQVYTDFTKAIEEDRFNYSDTFTDEPTPPPPAADTPAEPPAEPTQLETEMNEAFGDQSSVVAPEPASTEVSEAPTDDGSYETASLGTGWAEDYVKRQEDRVNAASETQVAALDTQTDVTNPDGLGGGSGSASDIILADATGETTESEQVAATQRTLKINPAAKKKVADEIEIEKIDTYAKALAAYTALIGSGQEDKLKRVKILVRQFAETPDIGSMNLRQLQAFMELTDPDAGVAEKYKSINPQVMASLRLYAKDFIQDLQNEALPSLSETDPEVLRGVVADIDAGRISPSVLYRNQLTTRIKALDEVAAAKKQEDLVFDEKYVEKAFFLARQKIMSNPDTDAETKASEWQLWQNTEGKALQEILRAGDKPDKPQEINNLQELATVELMASEQYQNADKATRLDMVKQTIDFLAPITEGSLTQGKYAEMVANYTRMLSSDDPAEVAAAKKWFSTEAPALEAGLKAGAAATARPGDPEKFQIRYTTPDGKTLRAEATKVEGGYRLDDGTVVAPDKTLFVRSTENQGYINDQLSRTRTERNKQRENMVSLVDLTQQAYALEQIAINDPVVLTLVGGGTTVVEAARTEAKALLTVITNASQDAFQDSLKDPAKASNRIEQALNKFIESNGITGETAANYRKFSAKLTRFVFAAGKALGQEGNGFSNQDYKNILNSLQAGNGIGAFVENLRSFVQERATFVDTGANSIRTLPEIQELMEYQTDLGFSTMTFDEYAKSEYAPVDYAEWLASPVPSASKPTPKSTVVLQQGEDGVWSLPSPE